MRRAVTYGVSVHSAQPQTTDPAPPVVLPGQSTTPIAIEPAQPRGLRGKIDDVVWSRILAAAHEGGWPAAYRVLSEGRMVPNSDGRGNTYMRPARRRTLEQVVKSDPIRGPQFLEAIGEFVDKAEDAAQRIALEPQFKERYDPQTGALVSKEPLLREQSWMLMNLLRRHDPRWREQRGLTVDGAVDVKHSAVRPGDFVLNYDDVQRLPREDQETLFLLLQRIEAGRQLPAGGIHVEQ